MHMPDQVRSLPRSSWIEVFLGGTEIRGLKKQTPRHLYLLQEMGSVRSEKRPMICPPNDRSYCMDMECS